MAYKDLHDTPFDDNTIAKLEIFEDYAQEWIPTWVMQDRIEEIHIFDFFAGTGYDKNGVSGSPIRILKKIQEQKGNLYKKEVDVVLHLNEFDSNKFSQLQSSCNSFLDTDKSLKHKVVIQYYNEDFQFLFPKLLPLIKKMPSLVYLDQNGIKFLSENYFLELEKTKETDFLYFASSSFFWRFGEGKEFAVHLEIDMDQARKEGYKQIHRTVTNALRRKLPNNTKLKLYPFSLKKGTNIHGIIFGATHVRAFDKFLNISWKKNGDNGDANFDIDNEANIGQLDMFQEPRLTKKESFERQVYNKIITKEIINNFQMLDFVYEQGHIGKHAADYLKQMKQDGVITFEGSSPCVTYESVHKKRKLVNYELKKK